MGQTPRRADISSITNALPCEITTTEEHGYSTNDFVRLSNLNAGLPIPNDAYPLQNSRYRIIVTSTTTFTLQDPITHDPIDSTNYPVYVSDGFCNLIATDFYYNNDEE